MSEANIWQPRSKLEADADSKSIPEKLIATEGQSSFSLTLFVYAVGTGALSVHKNGLLLTRGTDWNEQTDTAFNIIVPCTVGDIIVATGASAVTSNIDVRDTDIFIPNVQALRDYSGTEITAYIQGTASQADGGAAMFSKVTGEALGYFVDNGDDIIVPTGGDGSVGWFAEDKGSVAYFATIAAAIISTNRKKIRNGGKVRIGDRGDALFNIVTSASVIPNTANIVQLVGFGTLALTLRVGGVGNVRQFGAVGDGVTDDLPAFNAALAVATVVLVPLSDNTYFVSDTVSLLDGQTLTGEDTKTRDNARCEIELQAGVNQPLIWATDSRTLVKNLLLTDRTAVDSVRDSWRVGIEVGTADNWNAIHVRIENVLIKGFYDSIHIAFEVDNLDINNIVFAQQTNANISFKRNRGPANDGGAIAPSSAVRIAHLTAQEGSHKQFRPISIDSAGVPSHDRYHLYLEYIKEGSVSHIIMNTAVKPVYLGIDTAVRFNDARIEPVIHTLDEFSGASLVVATNDVIQFPNGDSNNTPHLYKAESSGTLTTKVGWGTTVGATFVIDGVTLRCSWKNVAVEALDVFVAAAFKDCVISRDVCYSLGEQNNFTFELCREFNPYTTSFDIGDQTTVDINSCGFPNGDIIFPSNLYLRSKGSDLKPIDINDRLTYDSQIIRSTSLDGTATTFDMSGEVTNTAHIIRLAGTEVTQNISVTKATPFNDKDKWTNGKIVTFIKTTSTGVINVANYSLYQGGDSISFMSRFGEPNPLVFNYSPRIPIDTTANRPVGLNNNRGYIYYDTTLGKPIFWSGTQWVDATGTSV